MIHLQNNCKQYKLLIYLVWIFLRPYANLSFFFTNCISVKKKKIELSISHFSKSINFLFFFWNLSVFSKSSDLMFEKFEKLMFEKLSLSTSIKFLSFFKTCPGNMLKGIQMVWDSITERFFVHQVLGLNNLSVFLLLFNKLIILLNVKTTNLFI